MEETNKQYTRIGAFLVGAIAFTAFIMTVAPTAAFWDCGEYVASGNSLAVPHPPGNPLYIMLARVFSIALFFFNQVGYRINMISVLSGTFTAVFIYLAAIRVMHSITGKPDTLQKRLTVHTAALVAGLFSVFGYTFWSSCVEAEVIVLAMCIMAVCTWLCMVWLQSTDPKRDRLLLLITYLTFMGIGVHMFTMILLAPLGLLVLMHDKSKRSDWRLWIVSILLMSVMYSISVFVWLGPLCVILSFIFSAITRGEERNKWKFCFWISFFALLGYSVHIFIPIRSALNPIIDENHPVITWDGMKISWTALSDFLDRKQYGNESMISRMFWRRGSWDHQFGIEGHMGFGGFHLTQFFNFTMDDTRQSLFVNGIGLGWAKLITYLIPTFIMLFGWNYLYKRNKPVAVFMIALVVITTIGLVFYMNFADGTRSESGDYLRWVQAGRPGDQPLVHREVRVRDYFWTPGFMYFGMWIGIAAGCILNLLFTSKNPLLRGTVAPIAVMLFFASPAIPAYYSWNLNSRHNDWIPYDYAYNLLMSCEKDGVLFTNGDNDTFPLWFLQEAEGIRKDVRIVNLSLLNTKWYIKQLKNLEPKVPISYTEKQIDNDVDHILNPFTETTRYKLPHANVMATIPGRSQQNALRIQDQLVLNIVDANAWKKPIYFAVTVSDDNRMGLEPYIQMQGLVYRLMPSEVGAEQRVDADRTAYLVDKVFRYRGIGDGKTRLNDTSSKLLSNYSAGFIHVILTWSRPVEALRAQLDSIEAVMADSTRKKIDPTLAINHQKKLRSFEIMRDRVKIKWDQCVGLIPWEWRFRAMRHEFLMRMKMYDEAEVRAREALIVDSTNLEYTKMLAQVLEQTGKKEEFNKLLKKLSGNDQNPWYAYMGICKNFEDAGMYDSAIAVMREFEMLHPGDRRAQAKIDQLQTAIREMKPQE